MRAALSLSRRLIVLLARIAPDHARRRWSEEWVAETEHAATSLGARRFGGARLILMTSGAMRDVVALRRAARLRSTGPRPGVFSGLTSDFRDASRSVASAPGFALGVIGSLAIGMAAVTAGFSVVNTALLKSPDGVMRPGEIVEVKVRRLISGIFQGAVTYDRYAAIRGSIPSLTDVAAFRSVSMIVGLPGEADSVPAALVSGNYFDVLGVRPALGRLLAESDDDRPGAHPVAVIAYETWLTHYGADPDVVGRIVKVNGHPLEIIGVAGGGFTGTRVEIENDSASYVWIPFSMGELVARDAEGAPVHPSRLTNFHVQLFGRLKAGAAAERTQADAAVVAARLFATGVEPPRLNVSVVHLGERPGSLWDVLGFMAVPGMVLLLACLNAANLLTSRASRRIRDMALRLCLGATAWRLIRQLLVESLLLSTAAALAGFAFTWVAMRVAMQSVPILLHVDWRVLLLATATAWVTAVGFGLAPAVAAAARAGDLVQRVSRRRGSFGRSLLIGAQAALSLALLATGGQFANAVRVAAQQDGLTAADRLIVGSLNVDRPPWSPADVDAYYERIRERLAQLPGITDVSFTCGCDVWGVWAPMGEGGGGVRLWLPQHTPDKPGSSIAMFAGGDIFEALELPLLGGRKFSEVEHAGPVTSVMVNQPFADRLEGPALGQQLRLGGAGDDFSTSQLAVVVGVVGTPPVKRTDSLPMLFYPAPLQNLPKRNLFVSVDRPAEDLVAGVRSTIRDVHPDVPRPLISTAEQARWARNEFRQIMAGAVSLLGVLALVLASAGLYGVVAFIVVLRHHEIAVRMALGAEPARVVRMVVRQAIRPAAVGAIVGAAGAAAMGMVVRSQFYGASPVDPVAFAGATALLLAVLVMASAIPARRAARVDPMAVLKAE
jgi:predicted permease